MDDGLILNPKYRIYLINKFPITVFSYADFSVLTVGARNIIVNKLLLLSRYSYRASVRMLRVLERPYDQRHLGSQLYITHRCQTI